jgi:hypothetical protein
MKQAWTGSRRPSNGYTDDDDLVIANDVMQTVNNGDEIATGGCDFVDAIVIRTASILRDSGMDLKIHTWPADGEKTWDQYRAPSDVLARSDEIHLRERGWKYLERDRALVDWANLVQAIPLEPFSYSPSGCIIASRGGTNYTARIAHEQGKLISVLSLRPRTLMTVHYCVGNPMRDIGTWCASTAQHEPHEFMKAVVTQRF